MDDTAIPAVFTQLLQVCTTFVATAERGADIRDYGLTPALLDACREALATWHVEPIQPTATEQPVRGNAAWHAYLRMRAEHGEDFR